MWHSARPITPELLRPSAVPTTSAPAVLTHTRHVSRRPDGAQTHTRLLGASISDLPVLLHTQSAHPHPHTHTHTRTLEGQEGAGVKDTRCKWGCSVTPTNDLKQQKQHYQNLPTKQKKKIRV